MPQTQTENSEDQYAGGYSGGSTNQYDTDDTSSAWASGLNGSFSSQPTETHYDTSSSEFRQSQTEARKNKEQGEAEQGSPAWAGNKALESSSIDEKKENAGNKKEALSEEKTKARNLKAKLTGMKDQAVDAAARPIRNATSRLLRIAWLNAIDTIGLSLIWVYFHTACNFVFGDKIFAPLGEEWIPEQAKEVSGISGKVISMLLKYGEVMVLFFVTVIVFIILLLASIMVYLIIYVIYHPIDSLIEILKLFGLKTTIEVLRSLYNLY